MLIHCKSFDEWIKHAGREPGMSPGGVANEFGVSRQSVNNWINNNVIDSYYYSGQEGEFSYIYLSEFDKIIDYRKKHNKI